MDKAIFQLIGYRFDKVNLNLMGLSNDNSITIDFKPRGIYNENKGTFKLIFEFEAHIEGEEDAIVYIESNSAFRFSQPIKIDEIPEYFYPNSIAIIVPYIRAFVSTVTLQANIKPIIIPTLNLMDLKDALKNNTVVEK